jgi:LacI family repressor for deo operon, udp, cdd, tsx, nupC, and nupG
MLRRNEADGMIVLGHRLPPTAREIVEQRGAAAPVVNGCEFDPARWASPASTSTTPPPHAR